MQVLLLSFFLLLAPGATAQQKLRTQHDEAGRHLQDKGLGGLGIDLFTDGQGRVPVDPAKRAEDPNSDFRFQSDMEITEVMTKELELGQSFPAVLAPEGIRKRNLDVARDIRRFKPFYEACCVPRVPKCCPLGQEMLWEVGGRMVAQLPGATATQPSIYNPKCFDSINFDTNPAGNEGQPFCHEIVFTAPSLIKAAQLELIIFSNPPCGRKDQLCLTMSTGKEWCTLLNAGENHLCLDLDELGLLTPGMDKLLVRVAYHSNMDYLRLHTIMCQAKVPAPTTPKSLHFLFENDLSGSSTPSTPPFTLVPLAATSTYMPGGPKGTSATFPSGPAKYLQMPNHASQQGGTKLSMAAFVYYDQPGDSGYLGYPFVTKLGSYRWMINPGQPWYYQHVHLGPGPGDIKPAMPRASDPDFTVPVQKWLCLAVTIDVNTAAATTTLSFYLNGELWGPPTVANMAYDMDGTADMYLNGPHYWNGKLDQFTLWQSVISAKDVNEYCNCAFKTIGDKTDDLDDHVDRL
jgi:hypothetical protein